MLSFPVVLLEKTCDEVEEYRYSHYWPCFDRSVIFNIDIRTTVHVLTVL